MNVDNFSKFSKSAKANYAKKSFKPITTRQMELLELVHLDLLQKHNW